MKVLSIIPARGGSKGLPGKNIICLNEKPLIAHTIEASLKSKYITKTVVSSDDDKILEVSKNFGSDILKRPDELALDTTSSEPVITHALESIKDAKTYDYVILLQPTSPLRTENDIDEAIEELLKQNATALISTVKVDNKILKAFKNNELGFLEGISNNEFPFMRRQDLPQVYMPNGAIYICYVKEFLKNQKLFTLKTISYEMSEDKSIDVDFKEDLDRIFMLMKKGKIL